MSRHAVIADALVTETFLTLYLQDARASGVTRRAYETIGFYCAGAGALVSFAKPQRILP
jgi:hypothetical protein